MSWQQVTSRLVICAALPGCKPQTSEPSRPPDPSATEGLASPCATLEFRLCKEFTAASDVCRLVRDRALRFEASRCSTLLQEYAQTVAELQQYQESRQLLARPDQDSDRDTLGAVGPPDAGVVLVIFCDFESPDCGRLSPLHTYVTNLYPTAVRLVFRHFPNPSNGNAGLAAEASVAAAAQGRFWDYHDRLFANPHDHGRVALERYAQEVGLRVPDFDAALDERRFADVIDRDQALAHRLFVLRSPALFVNGRASEVPYGVTELARVIEGARSNR